MADLLMPPPKESGKAQSYADQVRSGVVLSRENLARFIEEQETERDALREALVKLADYEGIVTPCDDRLCVECRTARVARAALERTP